MTTLDDNNIELFLWAAELTKKLAAEYGVGVTPIWSGRGRRSYAKVGAMSITFQLESLERRFKTGWTEYPSVAWVLGGRLLKGYDAIHMLVLHEFAHILCKDEYLEESARSHGREFQATLKSLIDSHKPAGWDSAAKTRDWQIGELVRFTVNNGTTIQGAVTGMAGERVKVLTKAGEYKVSANYLSEL